MYGRVWSAVFDGYSHMFIRHMKARICLCKFRIIRVIRVIGVIG